MANLLELEVLADAYDINYAKFYSFVKFSKRAELIKKDDAYYIDSNTGIELAKKFADKDGSTIPLDAPTKLKAQISGMRLVELEALANEYGISYSDFYPFVKFSGCVKLIKKDDAYYIDSNTGIELVKKFACSNELVILENALEEQETHENFARLKENNQTVLHTSECNSGGNNENGSIPLGMKILICLGSWFLIAIMCALPTLFLFGTYSIGGIIAPIIAIALTATSKSMADYEKIFERTVLAGVILVVTVIVGSCIIGFA